MLLKAAPLILLPLAAAAGGVHKLKLSKLPQTLANPELESAYLVEKYGGEVQTPLMGAGGAGRNVRLARPSHQDGEPLFWTQEDALANGGHSVPLSSMSSRLASCKVQASDVTHLDFMNAQYFAEIELGSPAQSVRAMFPSKGIRKAN